MNNEKKRASDTWETTYKIFSMVSFPEKNKNGQMYH